MSEFEKLLDEYDLLSARYETYIAIYGTDTFLFREGLCISTNKPQHAILYYLFNSPNQTIRKDQLQDLVYKFLLPQRKMPTRIDKFQKHIADIRNRLKEIDPCLENLLNYPHLGFVCLDLGVLGEYYNRLDK